MKGHMTTSKIITLKLQKLLVNSFHLYFHLMLSKKVYRFKVHTDFLLYPSTINVY